MSSEQKKVESNNDKVKQPIFFISHGGGPCFFMEDSSGLFSEMDKHSETAKFYKNFFKHAQVNLEGVKGIVVISAHWEESQPTVQTNLKPPLYYDYYGFPDETYELKYPAPGDPQLARRVTDLLKAANFNTQEDDQRGYDHGVFIPLKLMIPEANIPIIQLSLISSLNSKAHINMGKALAPLREEGIMIIASGQVTHNLGSLRRASPQTPVQQYVKNFVGWTTDAVTNPKYSPKERLDLLENFQKAPSVKEAHPRAEHYVPILVAAGAAEGQVGKLVYDKVILGHMSLACYQF